MLLQSLPAIYGRKSDFFQTWFHSSQGIEKNAFTCLSTKRSLRVPKKMYSVIKFFSERMHSLVKQSFNSAVLHWFRMMHWQIIFFKLIQFYTFNNTWLSNLKLVDSVITYVTKLACFYTFYSSSNILLHIWLIKNTACLKTLVNTISVQNLISLACLTMKWLDDEVSSHTWRNPAATKMTFNFKSSL